MYNYIDKYTCEKCLVRLPKNRPRLVCSHCLTPKHYRCQGLSKNDAINILEQYSNYWTCAECMIDIFPINACSSGTKSRTETAPKFKSKCACCSGYSYTDKNVGSCPWCEGVCHVRCLNGRLGCNKCCEDIIPGFHVNSYELYGIPGYSNRDIFDPYHRTHNTNLIGDRISNDEECANVWSEMSDFLINCKYKLPKNVQTSKQHELNILSLNVRSLSKNISVINSDIADYQKYDALLFNETNLNIDKLPNGLSDLEIEGFHPPFIQAPKRASCRGGGLATYINKNVCDYDKIEIIDLNSETTNLEGEILILKINECKGFGKSVLVGNLYRSPSCQPTNFITQFENILQKLERHANKTIVLAGDVNIDLIHYANDINCQNIIDITTNHGFMQLISRPTRVTDHSATLIDHIYTNKLNSIINTSIITLDISDHLGTLVTISLNDEFDRATTMRNKKTESSNPDYRMFNEANDEIFRQCIADEDWSAILDEPNLNSETQYDRLAEIYTKHYDSAYPTKKNRVRRKKERANPKPWILPWLEEACDRKNRLYHQFVKDPTLANKIKYNKLKKFVEKHIKLAKNKYYNKYFEQYKDNSKKQWQMINSLLNRNTKSTTIRKVYDKNGNVCTNPHDITDNFNEYFANIATKLKTQINTRSTVAPGSFETFLKQPSANSIYLKPVHADEIHQIVKNLKNKSTLDTKISALKISNSDYEFTHTLARIITASFEQGVFPRSLKLARVVPIHKAGPKTDITNYRPISLLSSFSKIYEKLMHSRIADFMNKNDSLHDMQYGFRAGRSCEHALLKAQSILLDTLNKKEIALLLLIDFSKAFDMVEHNILLKKLEHYGIRGTALLWLKSYLENREQFVSISGVCSSKRRMGYGVPQGSILGPLLFIIYINDMPEISKLAKFILYADDANIIITGRTVDEVNAQLNVLSDALLSWVDSNGLALNLKKTKYMIFSRQRIDSTYRLEIANTVIERKSEAMFLGVIVDEKLNWSHHISALKSKMSRYIGIMFKLKNILPLKARIQIFHSFVQSHINYCSLIWGFSSKCNIESIFTKQKKGMRTVMPGCVNYFFNDGNVPEHTKPAFNKSGVLTVQGVIVKNALLFMHKVKHFPHILPQSIVDTIAENAPSYGSTHETCDDWLNEYNNAYHRKSIFFKGPLLAADSLNIIPDDSSVPINIYKSKIKSRLLDIQNLGDVEEWQPDNFLLYCISGLRVSTRIKITSTVQL